MTSAQATLASVLFFAVVAGMIGFLLSTGAMPTGLGAIAAVMALVAIVVARRAALDCASPAPDTERRPIRGGDGSRAEQEGESIAR